MSTLSGLAVFLQDTSHIQGDTHLIAIYLGMIAITFLALVAVVLIGGLIAAAFVVKQLKRVEQMASRVDNETAPIIQRANQLLQDLTPKIKNITENTEQISYTVRTKVDELSATIAQLNETILEINGKTRVQVGRVDGMVSEVLETTQEISQTVQNGIRGPVRQIAGIIAGVRAGIETLVERSPFRRM